VIKAEDYKTAAKALQKAGYSTYSNYANQLIDIIERYDLVQYDVQYIAPKGVSKKSERRDIRWLQLKLNTFCNSGEKLTLDGIWGTKTATKLKKYYTQVGLEYKSYASIKLCEYLDMGVKAKTKTSSVKTKTP